MHCRCNATAKVLAACYGCCKNPYRQQEALQEAGLIVHAWLMRPHNIVKTRTITTKMMSSACSATQVVTLFAPSLYQASLRSGPGIRVKVAASASPLFCTFYDNLRFQSGQAGVLGHIL